jgi:predicted nucleic acid-binding protein
MRLFLDTSVLVAALVEPHPAHDRALPWLQRIRDGSAAGVISAHSLAELYSILTTLPVRPRISPVTAQQLIRSNIHSTFEVVSLSADDYASVIDHLADMGILGGATYDAVILQAAAKANPDQVVTLNEKDFRRIRPDLAPMLVTP